MNEKYQGESSIIDPDDFTNNISDFKLDDTLEYGDGTPQFTPSQSPDAPLINQQKLDEVIQSVDGLLERLQAREMLPAAEATDYLLDLRLQLVAISE